MGLTKRTPPPPPLPLWLRTWLIVRTTPPPPLEADDAVGAVAAAGVSAIFAPAEEAGDESAEDWAAGGQGAAFFPAFFPP